MLRCACTRSINRSFHADVRYVADHAKRAVSSFPLSDRPYYGVDYAERARSGVPADEMPGKFVPDGSYAGQRSELVCQHSRADELHGRLGTEQDFFGGYDHAARAGVVHVADHHIAPGKEAVDVGQSRIWLRLGSKPDG